MRRVLLLACCLTVAVITAPTGPTGVPAIATAAPIPKGASAAPKSKEVVEEEKKAAYYKALRESYECLRDSLPRGAERSGLESDMNRARDLVQTLIHIEKNPNPRLRASFREAYEEDLKRFVADSPRCKELFEIYSHELGLTAVASLKSKNVEEEEKAHYEELRRSYESLLNTSFNGPGRFGLQADMELAREAAHERFHIEKIADPKRKALRLEEWEKDWKSEVMRTRCRKELFELYSYELSQMKRNGQTVFE